MEPKRIARTEVMGKQRIWPLLLRFAGPPIISSVVAASYNLVDAVFIGQLGTEALAAMAIAFPLMIIYFSIGMGVAVGAASLISRNLGAGKRTEADRVAGNAITLFLLISTVATVIFYFSLPYLLALFGASGKVLEFALAYMRVETICIPVNILLVVLCELVRSEGNAILSSSASILSGVINCIFDPMFMFGIAFFPKLGIAGAAVATSVGRGISIIILIIYLSSGRSSYNLRREYFKPVFKIFKDILRIGSSSMVRQAGGCIVQILANRVASAFGVVPLAVLGVLDKLNSLGFQPPFGLGQGILPLIGFNFGAKKLDRIREIISKATVAALLWGALVLAVVMLFPTQILGIFGNDPDYLKLGAWALGMYSFVFLFSGAQTVLSSFFQGLGKAMPALIVSSSRQMLFLIPAILILPPIMGLAGLWVAFSLAGGLSLVLALVWAIFELRHLGVPFTFPRRLQVQPATGVDPPDVHLE